MKTLQFKEIYSINGETKLRTINVKGNDTYTYYSSTRMNPELKHSMAPYCLYDKNTGQLLVSAYSKQSLFEEYNKMFMNFYSFTKSFRYIYYTTRYKQLKQQEKRK